MIVVVLLTGFVWPGWLHRSTTVNAACPLLSTSEVQQTFGITGLSDQEQGPVYDHGTPAHICTYDGPNGSAEVVLSVADYPPIVNPDQLVRNTASSGVGLRPTSGIGDYAAFVNGVGHTDNLSLITAVRVDQHVRLIMVTAAYQINPLDSQLTGLVKAALAAG